MQIFGGKGRGKLIKERPPTSQQNEKLSFGSKIAFALGGLGVAIGPGTIIPFWYTFFLTDIARLDLGVGQPVLGDRHHLGRTEQPDRRLSVRPHPHPLGATAAIPAVWGVARGVLFSCCCGGSRPPPVSTCFSCIIWPRISYSRPPQQR